VHVLVQMDGLHAQSQTILLQVVQKTNSHTAESLSQTIRGILDEWDLRDQYTLPLKQRMIKRFVTDTTATMLYQIIKCNVCT